jgi:hypothetical protein
MLGDLFGRLRHLTTTALHDRSHNCLAISHRTFYKPMIERKQLVSLQASSPCALWQLPLQRALWQLPLQRALQRVA